MELGKARQVGVGWLLGLFLAGVLFFGASGELSPLTTFNLFVTNNFWGSIRER